MSEVRVIGIGSPFGNDTIGWQVIEMLKQQHMLTTLLPERVDLIETDRPGVNLIQMLQGASFVILVDAVLDKYNHGEVVRFSKDRLITAQNMLSSHSLDVASAIALADKLRVLPDNLLMLGLAIDARQEDPVSGECIHKLVDAIVRELEEYFAQA
jgi:hydrogenase maturation protease